MDGWLGWLWMGYGRVVGWLWLGGLEGKREVGCRWVVWWAKGGGEKGAGKGVGSGLEGEKGAGKGGGFCFRPFSRTPKQNPSQAAAAALPLRPCFFGSVWKVWNVRPCFFGSARQRVRCCCCCCCCCCLSAAISRYLFRASMGLERKLLFLPLPVPR